MHRQWPDSADYVLLDGRREVHKEGAYYSEWYLDGRRCRESAGKNPSEAFAVAERKAQVLRNQALGNSRRKQADRSDSG
jgi:hypothetical protein